MTRVVMLLCLAFVGLAAAPRQARAEDAATKTAKRYFDKGEKLFALGRFDEALAAYQKAYEAKEIPDFLYDMGQCYRNLDDFDAAIHSYKQYLQRAPDAANREQVEKLIDDLEAKKERIDAAKREKDKDKTAVEQPTPVVVVEAHPVYTKWWFWTGIVIVGAAAGVGIFEATKPTAPSTDLGTIAAPILTWH